MYKNITSEAIRITVSFLDTQNIHSHKFQKSNATEDTGKKSVGKY